MTEWKIVEQIFNRLLKRIGNPRIILVVPDEWNKMFPNYNLNENMSACCDIENKVLTIDNNETVNEIKDSIWHEFLHILFPNAGHCWIECVAQKMIYRRKNSRYNHYRRGFHSKRYDYFITDVPSRQKLIKLIKKASRRIMRKV